MRTLVFVGDIHGDAEKLERILVQVKEALPFPTFVFLGDYINKGNDSKRVLDILIALSREDCVFLRGNHESVMLRALNDDSAFAAFLKMGGASTIRSYLAGQKCRPNAREHFKSLVPQEHINFLQSLADKFENDEIVAAHELVPSEATAKFRIAGHRPVESAVLKNDFALIDTNCGVRGGFLTALAWPDRRLFTSR